MKKIVLYMVFAVAMVLPLSGCLHNNGDIGPWFGQWKIERIEKNGEPAKVLSADGKEIDYNGIAFLRFQSEVVVFATTNRETGSMSANTEYGNWVESDGYMRLDFKREANSFKLLNRYYLDKKCDLKVVKRDGRDKVLEYERERLDVDGKPTGEVDIYTYYLKKW